MERHLITRILTVFMLILMGVSAKAQDDFGIWMDLGAEKKITKKLSVGAEADIRTFNNVGDFDRVSFTLDGSYRITKNLKAAAGYSLLYENNIKQKFYTDSEGQPIGQPKWTRQYWGLRHRAFVQLQGDVDLGRWNISLRERWQYTYRPSTSAVRKRYNRDGDFVEEEPDDISSKSKNVLRSRLQVSYDIRHCVVDPFASIELTNDWKTEKTRYCVGAEWKIDKKNSLDFTYMYQNVHEGDDDNEPNSHIVSISYKHKL